MRFYVKFDLCTFDLNIYVILNFFHLTAIFKELQLLNISSKFFGFFDKSKGKFNLKKSKLTKNFIKESKSKKDVEVAPTD
jgi:hypothetical protein